MKVLRIFVSSPGDVAAEREQARRVIGQLNAEFSRFLQLKSYFWEEHGQSATAHFQDQIKDPADFDLVVCLLWSRLGTLLSADRYIKPDGSYYRSGTEYEIDRALSAFREKNKPDLYIYRNFKEPMRPISQEDAEAKKQWAALNAFWDDLTKNLDGSLKAVAFNEFRSTNDFAEKLKGHLRDFCLKNLPAFHVDASESGCWTRDESPFRGLLAFQPEHADVFFGRRAARNRLLVQLEAQAERDTAFVLLLGISGCGKSSLVQAGLVPWLCRFGAGGIADWHWRRLQPATAGGDLLAALAQTLLGIEPLAVGLAEANHGETAAFAHLLRCAANSADHAMLHRLLHKVPETTRVLLLVDQFEELFAPGGPDAEAQAVFVAALAALAQSRRVWIVATLRSDAYAQAAAVPGLVALKAGAGSFDLAPPGAAELNEIVRYPAFAARLEFERDPETGKALDECLLDAAARAPMAFKVPSSPCVPPAAEPWKPSSVPDRCGV